MKKFTLAGLVLLIGLGAAVIIGLKIERARLRARVEDLRRENTALAGVREENRRRQDAAAEARRQSVEAARAMHDELLTARRELAEAQRAAPPPFVLPPRPTAEEIARNRDPERALTLLEHFRDVGNASPRAAFQTMVWAVMQGADDRLGSVFAFDQATQEKAEALLARLPPEARAKYPTPERLVGLFLASDMLAGSESVRLLEPEFTDETHAFQPFKTGAGQIFGQRMQRDPGGWRLVVPPAAIDYVNARLRGNGRP